MFPIGSTTPAVRIRIHNVAAPDPDHHRQHLWSDTDIQRRWSGCSIITSVIRIHNTLPVFRIHNSSGPDSDLQRQGSRSVSIIPVVRIHSSSGPDPDPQRWWSGPGSTALVVRSRIQSAGGSVPDPESSGPEPDPKRRWGPDSHRR